jgi:hypothetical protein
MSYQQTIADLAGDPEGLERAYRTAVKAGDETAFAEAIEAGYARAPGNVLLAAWHHRLAGATGGIRARVVVDSLTRDVCALILPVPSMHASHLSY